MDDKLHDMMVYICEKYPHKSELSNARLTKMIYLADWKSAIETGSQISNLQWVFNHYGPYVEDISNLAIMSPDFEVTYTTNLYGGQKTKVNLARPVSYNSLTKKDREILDHVIEQTKTLYWDKFIQLVYSTFPIVSSSRYSDLDLSNLAHQYHGLISDL